MQNLYFIRHAIAMEREDHEGPDLDRPLTEAGRKRARQAFRGLAGFVEAARMIISSRATRAMQTAALLREVWPAAVYQEVTDLNPGAGPAALQSLLASRTAESPIALVGHEPDFSEMIASLISKDGSAAVQVKKASFIEVQLYAPGRGELISAIPPRILRGLRS